MYSCDIRKSVSRYRIPTLGIKAEGAPLFEGAPYKLHIKCFYASRLFEAQASFVDAEIAFLHDYRRSWPLWELSGC